MCFILDKMAQQNTSRFVIFHLHGFILGYNNVIVYDTREQDIHLERI